MCAGLPTAPRRPPRPASKSPRILRTYLQGIVKNRIFIITKKCSHVGGYNEKVNKSAWTFISNSLVLPFQWSSWLTLDLGDHLPGEILGTAQKSRLRGM